MTPGQSPSPLRYALITPARDEAEFIEQTLRSVIVQTTLPIRWIIVSDGSTDGTDEIVRRYAARYAWIDLLRIEGPDGRDFARKARAFNTGYEHLHRVPYHVVGNLDADLTFDEDLFALLLARFAAMPELGVAGVPYVDGGVGYSYRFTNIEDVSGCCQLFRRECLEQIGGYFGREGGGIDAIAVTTARMNGWQTKTFLEKVCVHYGKGPSLADRRIATWFRRGEKDYALGNHPVWQVARSAYQSTFRPYGVGGLMLLAGYTGARINGRRRPVSDEFVRFRRAEQMHRLRQAPAALLRGARSDGDRAGRDLSVHESIARLQGWVEGHDYKGYEPFDTLSSPVRRLTRGHQLVERALVQIGRWSPVNLRPLLGIQPLESTKARGYMARGYLASFERTGGAEYRSKAVACLEWLMRNTSPLYADCSWGNHFDYASRAGRYSQHESTIVWTALIGQAFVDAYEQLGEQRHLEVARSVCRWILKLPRETSAAGSCFSYLAGRQLSIHNANLLGAAMLARTARHTGEAELLAAARAAVEYSCSRQHSDGAWYYGEAPIYHWIDSFHTGYNLDSLGAYIESTGDDAFRPHLERGARYFQERFVEPDGRPRYYHDRTYPIDIQCAAQAIETLVKLSDRDRQALPMAVRVARWTIRNMQDASGYFYYRRYPFFVARIAMIHWGQATMYRALALLSLKLTQRAQRAEGTAAAADADCVAGLGARAG